MVSDCRTWGMIPVTRWTGNTTNILGSRGELKPRCFRKHHGANWELIKGVSGKLLQKLMQNLTWVCENTDVAPWDLTSAQASGLLPKATSTEPVVTHHPPGSSQVFPSLLEKDMILAENTHTFFKVATWTKPGQRQQLWSLGLPRTVDRVSRSQKRSC